MMVQQNYIQRLAMGRSAFELPASRDPSQDPSQDEIPSIYTTDPNIIAPEQLVQEYDERGHPINPVSRAADRRLRRAQNDVLSTIGFLEPTSNATSQQTHHSSLTTTRNAHRRTGSVQSSLSQREQQRRLALEEFEEWSSLWLSLGCDALSLTATAFIRNQRKRIQTFRIYNGLSLARTAWTERRHQSFLSYWLASETATWAEHAAELLARLAILTIPGLIETTWDGISALVGSRNASQSKDEEHHPTKRILMSGLETSLTLVMEIALAPSTAIIALQRLQLVAPTPLIPLPWHYSVKAAYFALLPPFPAIWTVRSTFVFLAGVPTSAIGLSLMMECFYSFFSPHLTRYSRALLPRPDNPDALTVVEAEESPEPKWFLHGYSHYQTSLKEEVGNDLRWLSKNLSYYFFRVRNYFVPPAVRKHRRVMLDTLNSAGRERHPLDDIIEESQQLLRQIEQVQRPLTAQEHAEHEERLRSIERSINTYINSTQSLPTESAQANRQRLVGFLDYAQNEIDQTMRDLRSSSPSPEDPATLEDDEQGHGEEPGSQRQANGPLNSHPIPSSAPPPSLTTSSPPLSPPLEPTNVQVRTRAGSTSTLHMDVEINRAAVDGTTYTTSFSASPHTPVVETSVSQVYPDASGAAGGLGEGGQVQKRAHYRVSAMSLLPSEMLGTVLVQCAVGLLRLPLESMYLRRVASGFLRATAPGEVATVYPLGTWLGGSGSGWKGRGLYFSNMLLCLGIEGLINTGCWAALSSVGFWMGRKWFSWGNL